MKKKLPALLGCVFCYAGLAQQISPHVVNSSGSTFSTPSAMLSFNVGESAVTHITGTGAGITQGFLQPPANEVSLKENKQSFTFVAFPNPVSSSLRIESDYKKTIRVKLVDVMGRTVYNDVLVNNSISMEQLPDGMYQLLLLSSEGEIIEVKTITKTN